MKLTVCFGDTKVVVPCGTGELTIRDLAFNALKRVRHTLPKLDIHDRVVVHSVTIARDGGILDWDDLVREVLDDRELVTAHFSIATLATSATTTPTVTSERDSAVQLTPNDPLFRHLCTPLVVDLCSDSGAGGSYHSGPQSNEASGSGESAAGFPRLVTNPGSTGNTVVAIPNRGDTRHISTATVEDTNLNDSSRSSSSLSLNMSSGSCNGHNAHASNTWRQQAQQTTQTVGADPMRKSSLPIAIDHSHSTCPHYGSHPSRTSDLNRVFRTVNNSVTDAAFWEPLRPTEERPRLNCSTPENSKVWHQAFSPTTFATLASVLCRRRDCIEMNWDTDEEDDEEDVRPTDLIQSKENGPDLNFIDLEDLPTSTAQSTFAPSIAEIWSGRQDHGTTLAHSKEESALGPTKFQDDISRTVPSNVSLLSTILPEVTAPELWPLPPEPVVEEPSGMSCLTPQVNRPYGEKSSSLVRLHNLGLGTIATNTPTSTAPEKSLPPQDCIVSVTTAPGIVTTIASNVQQVPLSWNKPIQMEKHKNFEQLLSELPQPADLLSSSARPLVNRTFFSGFGVPTIVEEEEEVSVDYDPSLMTSSVQKPVSDYIERSTTGANTLCPTQEIAEEDYPLLRPDYFVNADRLEHSNAGTTTTNYRDVSPSPMEKTGSLRDTFLTRSSLFQHMTDEGVHHRSCTPRGLPVPAVLRWLESTQTANELQTNEHDSPTSISTPTNTTETNITPIVPRTDLSERKAEQGQQNNCVRTVNPDTVLVRLVNTRRGENLGIQIKPVFVASSTLQREVNKTTSTTDRVESGLEVHHIMPHGRVAREGCLSVGDRILSINGTSLAGMPFEKGRDMFQAALSQPELVLEVLPHSAQTIASKQVETEKPDKPSYRFIILDDQNAKAKEAEAQGKLRSDKAAPPPPPRRSPNTMLTRTTTATTPPLLEGTFQDKALSETSCHLPGSTTILSPKDSGHFNSASLPAEECIAIYLQKGSNGLGFSLTSRDHPVTKERVVCVKSILPGGAALLDGRLRPGDRLVQVDGHDVAVLGQARTVHLLRETPVNSIVKLLVWREPAPTDNDVLELKSSSNKPSSVQDTDERLSLAVVQAVQSSPKKVETLATYQKHSIDSTHFKIFELHIPLPPTSARGSSDTSASSSSSSPVTLGVSVSVRPSLPPHVPVKGIQREQDNSENAVFVRTVIEGGAAYCDGRLRVGDRLLAIDDKPLSGISSADALTRMKTIIARNLAEKQPCVRLLIARLRIESESDKQGQSTNEGPEVTNTTRATDASSGRLHTLPTITNSMPQISDAPPIPVKTSMVVAAEVHSSDTAQNSRNRQSRTTSSSRTEHPSSSTGVSRTQELIQSTRTTPTPVVQKPASHRKPPRSTTSAASDELSNRDKTKHHHSHRQYRKPSHSTRSSRRKERKSILPIPVEAASSTVLKYRTSASPVVDPTGIQTQTPDSSPPTLRCHSCADTHVPPSPASTPLTPPPASQRFQPKNNAFSSQRDSDGTISSTDLLEDRNQTTLSKVRDFTHPKEYSSDTDVNGSSTAFSDPETERRSSFRHSVRYNSRRQIGTVVGLRNHNCRDTLQPCRVIIQQPQIDLSQMVLVPFDPDAWNGPVLKPRSSLKPEELAQLSPDHQHSVCQVQNQMARRTHSRESTPASDATTTLHSALSKIPNISYDSDGGTSRKTSQSSGTDFSVKRTHRRIIGKILKLVKSGRHRRFSHTELSVGTQTDPPIFEPLASSTIHPSLESNYVSTNERRATYTANSHRFAGELNLVSPVVSTHFATMYRTVGSTAPYAPIPSHSYVPSTNVRSPFPAHTLSQELEAGHHLTSKSTTRMHVYNVAKAEPQAVHVTSSTGTQPSIASTCLPHVSLPEPRMQQVGRPNHPYADLSFHQPAEANISRPNSCTKGVQTSLVFPTVNNAQSSINRLFDTDASSCSTAYESVLEFLEPTETGHSSPKQKTNREVYEDAEALYRYLADIKQRTADQETQATTSNDSPVKNIPS